MPTEFYSLEIDNNKDLLSLALKPVAMNTGGWEPLDIRDEGERLFSNKWRQV